MILPLLMLGLGGPTVLGLVRPEAREVGFAAVATLPELSARDRQLVHVLARVLPQGTNEYTVREALNVTDGRTVRCDALPDCVMVRFAVSPNEISSGASLLTSLLRNGTFRQDHIDAAVNSLGRREQDAWSRALWPVRFGIVKTSQAEMVKLYRTIFRPSAVTVTCVAASAEPLLNLWEGRFLGWKGAEPFKYPSQVAPLGPLPRPSEVSSLNLMGKPAAHLAATALSMYAFGAGKESSLHRIAREKLGWSYRQESLLWPAEGGWVPRLLIAMASPDPKEDRALVLKEALLADVESWTEETRKRALGMASANLTLGLPIGPFYLGPRPFAGYADDYAAFTCLIQAKLGKSITPEQLQEQMSLVSLDQLKITAKKILQP